MSRAAIRAFVIRASRRMVEYVATAPGLPDAVRRVFGGAYEWILFTYWRYVRITKPKSPNHYIARILRKGDVHIDVGASFGGTTSVARVAVGNGGHVYAFEPQAQVFDLLTHKKHSFGWTNVTLTQAVVGDKDGECVFYEDTTTRMSSLSADWAGGIPCHYSGLSLDSWAERTGIKNVNLVKVDVEGAELLVVRGARNLLRQTKPSLLLEINNRSERQNQYGYTIDDLIAELRSLGYAGFYALRERGLHRIEGESELIGSDRDMLAEKSDGRQTDS